MSEAGQDSETLKDFDEDIDADGEEVEFNGGLPNAGRNGNSAQARHLIELYWERKRLAAELGDEEFEDFEEDWLPPSRRVKVKRRTKQEDGGPDEPIPHRDRDRREKRQKPRN